MNKVYIVAVKHPYWTRMIPVSEVSLSCYFPSFDKAKAYVESSLATHGLHYAVFAIGVAGFFDLVYDN